MAKKPELDLGWLKPWGPLRIQDFGAVVVVSRVRPPARRNDLPKAVVAPVVKTRAAPAGTDRGESDVLESRSAAQAQVRGQLESRRAVATLGQTADECEGLARGPTARPPSL